MIKTKNGQNGEGKWMSRKEASSETGLSVAQIDYRYKKGRLERRYEGKRQYEYFIPSEMMLEPVASEELEAPDREEAIIPEVRVPTVEIPTALVVAAALIMILLFIAATL